MDYILVPWIAENASNLQELSHFSFKLINYKHFPILCGRQSACHKKSYVTNLEVRNLKSEISCLCPMWLSQFCLFWKKMGKGFVNIPKFVNSTHNKYLFLWHADHIKIQFLKNKVWVNYFHCSKMAIPEYKNGYSLKELGLLFSVSILQIRPSIFKEIFWQF